MVTISHIVKKIIKDRPLLEQALARGIVNYAALAELIQKNIENELGKPVKESAIVMALRRHAEELTYREQKSKFDYRSELTIKTNLIDLNLVKSLSLISTLKHLHSVISYESGDVLNIIQGSYEVSIVTNERYKKKIMELLKGEKILKFEDKLASIALKLPPEFLHTPGVISKVASVLAWENINIYELITTMTEMTFIIKGKDMTRAYNALQALIEGR